MLREERPISPLYLPYISPVSPCISPTPPLSGEPRRGGERAHHGRRRRPPRAGARHGARGVRGERRLHLALSAAREHTGAHGSTREHMGAHGSTWEHTPLPRAERGDRRCSVVVERGHQRTARERVRFSVACIAVLCKPLKTSARSLAGIYPLLAFRDYHPGRTWNYIGAPGSRKVRILAPGKLVATSAPRATDVWQAAARSSHAIESA